MSDPTLRVLLVDPSLFTEPYDAALTEGLLAAGVEPTWAVRPARGGESPELAAQHRRAMFYRHVDDLALPSPVRAALKGLSHALGLLRLVRYAHRHRPEVVHFQWLVLPLLDSLAVLVLQRFAHVVLTVHDTIPFNGDRLSLWQRVGFDLPLRFADSIIVHTRGGRDTLIRRGISAHKVTVIPHGPLRLPGDAGESSRPRSERERWTFVLFGEIKPYKGLDVLIEAVALLPEPLRERARFVVAGRPRMDLSPLQRRIEALGLSSSFSFILRRLTHDEMRTLFDAADCFLFPYRQIDASGVYFLVRALPKWLIASNTGIFAEDLADGRRGTLVPASDPRALADAIASSIVEKRTASEIAPGQTWRAIGGATRALYRRVTSRQREPKLALSAVEE